VGQARVDKGELLCGSGGDTGVVARVCKGWCVRGGGKLGREVMGEGEEGVWGWGGVKQRVAKGGEPVWGPRMSELICTAGRGYASGNWKPIALILNWLLALKIVKRTVDRKKRKRMAILWAGRINDLLQGGGG